MSAIDDHDQRFKTLIREFFADFMRLFFADWAARMDLSQVTWLEQEVLPDPPDGTRHVIDLLAQTPATGPDETPYTLLVHVEIESPDRTTSIKARLPRYFVHLRDKYPTTQVLPVVVYLSVGLDGVGIDTAIQYTGALDVLTMKYLYVGLPALSAEEYVAGDNWLGVSLAALMRIPPERVAWLGAEVLRRLGEAELTEQQRYLLAECVHNYLPMEEDQTAEFERMMSGDPKRRAEYVKKTLARRAYDEGAAEGLAAGIEKGIEKGMEVGMEKGMEKGMEVATPVARKAALVEVCELLLAGKFGPLPVGVPDRLRTLAEGDLKALAVRVPAAATLAELGL